ncbi:MAG: alternative ribosome rescue aminoacyl-tRNA hydrolase ArfB [Gammaproteobacteria bacterium]
MLKISKSISISGEELELTAIRAQGAGGQNINKVSSAIHLRFDIHQSSLPKIYKDRLLKLEDYRITRDGVINIKAQRFRTQLQNKEDALERLRQLIQRVLVTPKKRKATKPTAASKVKRVDEKKNRSKLKVLRRKTRIDSE